MLDDYSANEHKLLWMLHQHDYVTFDCPLVEDEHAMWAGMEIDFVKLEQRQLVEWAKDLKLVYHPGRAAVRATEHGKFIGKMLGPRE